MTTKPLIEAYSPFRSRETFDVTTAIFNNHSYSISNIELSRVGAKAGGTKAKKTLASRMRISASSPSPRDLPSRRRLRPLPKNSRSN